MDCSKAIPWVVADRSCETAGKGIYRHDAEGSDDMPVYKPWIHHPREDC